MCNHSAFGGKVRAAYHFARAWKRREGNGEKLRRKRDGDLVILVGGFNPSEKYESQLG